MILNFVNKGIVSKQLSLLVHNSQFLFCNSNKGGGMKKFQRPKKSKANQKIQEGEASRTQTDKTQNSKNNIEGNKITSQSNNTANQKQKQYTASSTNDKKIAESKKEVPSMKGFSNFYKKTNDASKAKINKPQQNISTNQNNFVKKPQQIDTTSKGTEKMKGFSNFIKNKEGASKTQTDINKNQQKINSNKSNFVQQETKNDATSKVEQKLKGFSNFIKKTETVSKKNNNFIKKPSSKVESSKVTEKKEQQKDSRILNNNQSDEKKDTQPNQKKEFQQSTNMKNQQKQKDSEAKTQKQSIDQQIAKKQRYFQQKVKQFKQNKNEKQLKNDEIFAYFRQIQQKIDERILKLTGIDINSKPNAPNFIKKNPMLLHLYTNVFNIKFIILGILLMALMKLFQRRIDQITPQQFIKHIQNGQAQKIIFQQRVQNQYESRKKSVFYGVVILKNGTAYQCVSNSQFENLVRLKVTFLNSMNAQNHMPPVAVFQNRSEPMNYFLSFRTFLSLGLLVFFIYSLLGAKKGSPGRGGANIFEQAKTKRFLQKVNVKFDDVVGMQKAKQQIVQFIDFLTNPQKYHNLGAKIPRGALLTGPPGTGKTMIAKACAGQSNVPFFTISGSEFMEMYVGVGAQRVRDLFKQAKQLAPSIIFIDEIDAVGKKRAAGFGGGNDQRDNTLNQLLVEMDGFNSNQNVIVFAATNQKQVLDSALTRPGRFDRLIQVDLPDIEGRKEIFMVHLKPIVIDTLSSMEQYARRMATLTPGFSGADIKNLCNEAAIMAARHDSKFVSLHDFELATQRVIGGVEKKSHLITPETKRIVAYHECGHGVVSWFLEGANPLLKLTIIPRSKGSLGFAQYLPHQTQISTKRQLQDQICVILGGRISQQTFFNKISTGAYDDLQKAYNIAKLIVTEYGMNQKLGWLSFEQSQYAKHYSKQTQRLIDEQILKIIKGCTERTRKIISQKRDLIQKLASKLLEVETIDLTKISQILGERPFKQNKQYEEYLKEHKKMNEENVKPENKSEPVAMKLKRTDYIF